MIYNLHNYGNSDHKNFYLVNESKMKLSNVRHRELLRYH